MSTTVLFSIRSTSIGLSTFFTRVGSLFGVLLVDSGLVYGNVVALPLAGLTCVAAGLAPMFFLPETAGRPLYRNTREEEEDEERRRRREEEDV